MCLRSVVYFFALFGQALLFAQATQPGLNWVEGGAFKHAKSNFTGRDISIAGFYLGKYEVTQKEWSEIMDTNPSQFKGDDLPVDSVTWYECVEFCNRRSVKEGLTPYYIIDPKVKDPSNWNYNDDIKWTVTPRPEANGYRLPTEAEWEYAASGGALSQSFIYCGSNDVDSVGWYWVNSGETRLGGIWSWSALQANKNRPRPVGQKNPNELGLFDLSGNVREWCWDWHHETEEAPRQVEGPKGGTVRVWKGGGWMGGDFCCEPSFRGTFEPHSRGQDQGFRIARTR